MKREKSDGLLRRLIGMFTRNFWFKLGSLILAVVIYVTLKPSASPERAQAPVLRTVTESFARPAPLPAPAPVAHATPAPATPPVVRPATNAATRVIHPVTTNATTRTRVSNTKKNAQSRK